MLFHFRVDDTIVKAIVSTLPEFNFFRDDSKTAPRLETRGRRRGRRKHPTKKFNQAKQSKRKEEKGKWKEGRLRQGRAREEKKRERKRTERRENRKNEERQKSEERRAEKRHTHQCEGRSTLSASIACHFASSSAYLLSNSSLPPTASWLC